VAGRVRRNGGEPVPQPEVIHRIDDALVQDRVSRRLSGLSPPDIASEKVGTSNVDGTYIGSVRDRIHEIESEVCLCGHVGRHVISSDVTSAGAHITSKCLGCEVEQQWDSSQGVAGMRAKSVSSLLKMIEFMLAGQGTYADYKAQLEWWGNVPESSDVYQETLELLAILGEEVLQDSIALARDIVRSRDDDEVGSWAQLVVTADGFYLVPTKGNGAGGVSPEAVMPFMDVRQVDSTHHPSEYSRDAMKS
jgi:hypothetical protein